MKKNALIPMFILACSPALLFGQCCNVVSSNGAAVSSSGGSCVTLTYPSSDCLVASSETTVPDSDGDGISDKSDKCPAMKGPASNMGCPVIMVEVWTLFHSHLKDVRFATNSDSLTTASYSKLDKVAMLLNDNKDYTLKVSGYADTTGTDEYNKVLSEKRAKTVKNYLVSKGVPEKKVLVASYGDKFPEAPNTSEAGRTKNRRVEFDLFY